MMIKWNHAVQGALIHIKRDPILYTALFLAIVSVFFVLPSKAYLSYIDYRVLALLLALMLVVAGFKRSGAFTLLTTALFRAVHTSRSLAAVLVGICFFSSMLITNDVALITFVPLAIMLLTQAKLQHLFIPVVALQTIAANLGSSFTPLGNPQNLYLFSLSGISAAKFLTIMVVPTGATFVLLCISLLFIRSVPLEIPVDTGQQHIRKRRIFPWCLLFMLCLLTVLRLLPYGIVLIIVIAAVIALDRTILWEADYGLLLTFVFLFIFIGNLKNIPAISALLSGVVAQRELMMGVLLSQVISNVPAAMLLSGFSKDYTMLLYGVNLGGLGTLIASMASMISYKVYSVTEHAQIGRYLAIFTGLNVIFLIILYVIVALFL